VHSLSNSLHTFVSSLRISSFSSWVTILSEKLIIL
jgi:hypothetical protein